MSQLSDQDFQRLQENLLELKNRNYVLEEQARKSKHAYGEASVKVKVLEEALEKSNRTLEKSKKATEVGQLIKENVFFQEKLNFQEEQFRFQTETLMQELNTLVRRNEELEKNAKTSSGRTVASLEADLCRIESENKELGIKCDKLQRKVEELQQQAPLPHDSVHSDSARILEMETKLRDLENVEAALTILKGEKSTVEGENRVMKERIVELTEKINNLETELNSTSERLKRKQDALVQVQQEKDSLLVAQRERETALTNQYEQEKISITEQRDRLQTQLNHTQEAYAEFKQASFQLNQEHQHAVEDLKVQLSELPPEKFKEQEATIICLRNEVESIKDRLEKEVERASAATSDLANSQMQMEDLHRQNEANNASLAQMETEIETLRNSAESRKSLIDEMALEMQKKTDELRILDRDSTARLEETKLAQAAAAAAAAQQLEKNGKEMKLLHVGQAALTADLTVKLAAREAALADQQTALEQHEQEKTRLEKIVEEKELNILNLKSALEEAAFNLDSSKLQISQELQSSHQEELQGLQTQLELSNVQKVEFEEKVTRLEQEIKDLQEEKKISEKKSQGVLKDVKRELAKEQRKNEKLQQKMKECFIDTDSNHSENQREVDPDRSSISSWSLMSGNTERERESSTPSQHSPDLPSSLSDPAIHQDQSVVLGHRDMNGRLFKKRLETEEETRDTKDETEVLLERIATVQQEKWSLEERLNMLEQSGAAMAEEIFRKNSLIQFYCMDAGRGPGPVRSVGSGFQSPVSPGDKFKATFMSPGGDRMKHLMDRLVNNDSAEMHAKEVLRMQQMLEETLTKNMHLQCNLDSLSQEVVRLSKLVPIDRE